MENINFLLIILVIIAIIVFTKNTVDEKKSDFTPIKKLPIKKDQNQDNIIDFDLNDHSLELTSGQEPSSDNLTTPYADFYNWTGANKDNLAEYKTDCAQGVCKKVRFDLESDDGSKRFFDHRLSGPLVNEISCFNSLENPTLQEVYDNHVVDYRKTAPKKTMKNDEANFTLGGANSSKSYSGDMWQYENESALNGGAINESGLTGYDSTFNGGLSVF